MQSTKTDLLAVAQSMRKSAASDEVSRGFIGILFDKVVQELMLVSERYDAVAHHLADAVDPSELARTIVSEVVPETLSPWNEVLGPFYRVDGVVRRLGISKQKVAEAVRDNQLLQLTTEDGLEVYPSFQFQDQRVIGGLSGVLVALAEGGLSPWSVASWLRAPQAELDNMSAIEWLRSGRDQDLAAATARASAARFRR